MRWRLLVSKEIVHMLHLNWNEVDGAVAKVHELDMMRLRISDKLGSESLILYSTQH